MLGTEGALGDDHVQSLRLYLEVTSVRMASVCA